MSTELLDRICGGDEAALGTLLEREWAGLVRFVRSRVHSAEEAEDVAQETFVRLWEHRERWATGSSARAVLFRIGTNAAADLGRKRGVRVQWQREEAGARPTSPPTPAEELELTEAQRRLDGALDRMAPQRREVFRLVRVEALTYREVAEVLDLSPQTVANHMSLALRQLRVELADLLPHHGSADATAGRTSTTDG